MQCRRPRGVKLSDALTGAPAPLASDATGFAAGVVTSFMASRSGDDSSGSEPL